MGSRRLLRVISDQGRCVKTNIELAEICGVSAKTVQRWLNHLVAEGSVVSKTFRRRNLNGTWMVVRHVRLAIQMDDMRKRTLLERATEKLVNSGMKPYAASRAAESWYRQLPASIVESSDDELLREHPILQMR
jgi:predicted ArsR family transcriptional regulator